MDYLTLEEARAVTEAPNVETWAGLRNRALLTTMFQTGIRSSEARALRLEDFYLHPSPGIHIRNGKGRKKRDLPLHANTVRELHGWLRVRGGREGPLFPTNRFTHMTSGALELIVNTNVAKAIKACPTLANRTITPHILRHTAAMFMLDSGVDLAVIALHLGHEDVKTTYRYLHHNRRTKEKAVNQTAYPTPRAHFVDKGDGQIEGEQCIGRTKYLKL